MESLRTATPINGGGTNHFNNKQKQLHNFFLTLREMKERKRNSMLCDQIDENALAPILYFCITSASQNEIDWLFTILTEMSHDEDSDRNDAIMEELHLVRGLNSKSMGEEEGSDEQGGEKIDNKLKHKIHELIHHNKSLVKGEDQTLVGTTDDPEYDDEENEEEASRNNHDEEGGVSVQQVEMTCSGPNKENNYVEDLLSEAVQETEMNIFV